MSNFLPRHSKDLPKLEIELDDEFKTPLKTKKAKHSLNNANDENSNKENVNTSATAQNQHLITALKLGLSNMRLRTPKHSSELPALVPDSDDDDDDEDDDILKNDHFNCAILNDSFLMSPSKSDFEDSVASSLADLHELSVNKLHNKTPASDNTSLIGAFNNMALSSSTTTKNKTINKCTSLVTTTTTTPAPAQPHILTVIEENEIAESSAEQIAQNRKSSHKKNQTPYKTKNTIVSTAPSTTTTTTTAANTVTSNTEAQFATPHIRSFSVVRPQRSLISTQTQKTRTTQNTNRSQKVLFQTPMAMTRAPVANDSITLSLCDTINKTPDATEKTSATTTTTTTTDDVKKAQKHEATKSKKSLENAFEVAQHEVHKIKQQQLNVATVQTAAAPATEIAESASASTSVASTNSTTAATAAANNEMILNIKNINYKILKKLGAGGSSSVYAAQRLDNDKECALKIVDLQGDPVVVKGYLNETKLLAKLQGNVCVVALYDYQLLQQESRLFVVMEKGDFDLNKMLQTYTTNLPLYMLTNILYQMLQAVNYIHQNGVIHSDLKPANFLMVNNRLKLIDFGIASNIAIDSTSIIKCSQAGTFNYISPEALIDTSTGNSPMRSNQPKIKISTKSDVWSLGCILYLLLYKKTPFSHIKKIPAKIMAIVNPNSNIEYPDIPTFYPVMLLHMVKSCLQHDPKKRSSCAELLQYPFDMIIQTKGLAVPETHKSV